MNRSLPGIGMRIIKSALAVAICYLINILRDGNGIVFYSQLAGIMVYTDVPQQYNKKRDTTYNRNLCRCDVWSYLFDVVPGSDKICDTY